MSKVAGIKNKSLETYPDHTGKQKFTTQSQINPGPVAFGFTSSVSLLVGGAPVEAGGAGEQIIVMFSGQFQWPEATESPAPSTVTVGIYLDRASTPSYSLEAYLPQSTVFPGIPQPLPVSLFWETPTVGAHEVDVRATASTGTGASAAFVSLVLVSTSV